MPRRSVRVVSPTHPQCSLHPIASHLWTGVNAIAGSGANLAAQFRKAIGFSEQDSISRQDPIFDAAVGITGYINDAHLRAHVQSGFDQLWAADTGHNDVREQDFNWL